MRRSNSNQSEIINIDHLWNNIGASTGEVSCCELLQLTQGSSYTASSSFQFLCWLMAMGKSYLGQCQINRWPWSLWELQDLPGQDVPGKICPYQWPSVTTVTIGHPCLHVAQRSSSTKLSWVIATDADQLSTRDTSMIPLPTPYPNLNNIFCQSKQKKIYH